ncbi:unnamed protein product, partial [Choristocarpus tenellus]
MQAMVEEQIRVKAAAKEHESMEGSCHAKEYICQRLERLQFKEGHDIFAVQWNDLHRMARTGDIRGLRYFIHEKREQPNAQDDRGDTPLNIAAAGGKDNIIEELAKLGADVNKKNNKA